MRGECYGFKSTCVRKYVVKTFLEKDVFLGVESHQSGKSAAGKNKSMAAR